MLKSALSTLSNKMKTNKMKTVIYCCSTRRKTAHFHILYSCVSEVKEEDSLHFDNLCISCESIRADNIGFLYMACICP